MKNIICDKCKKDFNIEEDNKKYYTNGTILKICSYCVIDEIEGLLNILNKRLMAKC